VAPEKLANRHGQAYVATHPLPEASVVQDQLLCGAALVLAQHCPAIANLALVAHVEVVLRGVALIDHCCLQAALQLLESFANESVRTHSGRSRLLQLLRLAIEDTTHLLTKDCEWLLVIGEPVMQGGRQSAMLTSSGDGQ